MNISLTKLCKYLGLRPKYLKLLSKRDTSDVWRKFAIWILVHPNDGFIRFTDTGSEQHDAISKVAQLYIDDCKDIQTWKTAARAAVRAAALADALCDYYYNADYSVAAVCLAAHASYCAASCDGAHATYCVPNAHDVNTIANAYSDAAACAAIDANVSSDDDAAAAAATDKMRKKLIELINSAPMITTND